jgi:hypothetical protein
MLTSSFSRVIADISVVFQDLAISSKSVYHPSPDREGIMELIPLLFLNLPYMFRLRQCLSEYNLQKGKARQKHQLNAIKYSLAMLALVATFMYSNKDAPYSWVYYVLQTSSSLYSLAWDIRMDWNITRERKYNFNRMYYLVACILNACLRMVWTLRLPKQYTITMELVRRWIWVFIRIEKEL